MAITKPRNRVVLFRLTEDEYDYLQQACEAGQARSISDFARSRILGQHVSDAQKSVPGDGISLDPPALDGLEQRLDQIQSAVDHLTQMVLGSGQPRKSAATVGSPVLRGNEMRGTDHG